MSEDSNLSRVKSHTTIEKREVETLASDRIELCEQANRLVDTLVVKDVAAIVSGTVVQPPEWSKPEKEAYESALLFLRDQFRMGYREPETVDKSKEVEYNTHYREDD